MLNAPPYPPSPQPSSQPARRKAAPLVAAVAAVVVAAGVAVWALVRLVVANDDLADAERELSTVPAVEVQPVATVRDEVSVAAQRAIAVLNTLDHRTVDRDLAAWAEVTTGELHEQVSTLAGDQRAQLVEMEAVTEGRVVRLAVRDLDERAGTATVLAAVEVVKESAGSGPTTAHQRMVATLTRAGDEWKLSALSSLPYEEPR